MPQKLRAPLNNTVTYSEVCTPRIKMVNWKSLIEKQKKEIYRNYGKICIWRKNSEKSKKTFFTVTNSPNSINRLEL